MGRYSHLKNNILPPNNFTKCIVGLDRDGVINVDRGEYTWRKQDFEIIPKSLDAIALIRNKGHKVVIITNQGGISKGLYTEDDVNLLHQHLLDLLGKAGCPSIDGIYFSATSFKNDPWAKPNTGMFKKASEDVKSIKWPNGFYVGDKITDLKAAHKIGATPVLVRTGHGRETEELMQSRYTYKSIHKKTKVYNTLWEFAQAL